MARDGLFFRSVGTLSESTRVPVLAIVVQAVWASILAMSGTYDQLTDYVVFATWLFFGLVTSSLFVLRRKMPNAPRPFRVPWYPLFQAFYCGNGMAGTDQPLHAASGVGDWIDPDCPGISAVFLPFVRGCVTRISGTGCRPRVR